MFAAFATSFIFPMSFTMLVQTHLALLFNYVFCYIILLLIMICNSVLIYYLEFVHAEIANFYAQ